MVPNQQSALGYVQIAGLCADLVREFDQLKLGLGRVKTSTK